MKKVLFYLIVLFLSFSVWSCSSSNLNVATIRIKGSDTMLPLTEKLAKEYMRNLPGVSIYVEGGGTGSGITALINGDIDIATASRNLKSEEAKTLSDYYGSLGMYFLIAKDALSVYVNPDNPIKDFSLQTLKAIFTCKITNWKELGGEDKKIIPVTRPPNSGTYLYFKEHVLEGDDYCESAVVRPTTNAVIDYIDDNDGAIGYGGIGYKENVYHASIEGITPSEQNARNDKYPITRYLHFFTSKTPRGTVKNFIDWVLSPEGQKIVEEEGYIPLWEISY